MLMIHNFFSLFTHLTSLQHHPPPECSASYIFLDVCQPFDSSTLQKLNFSSLDSNNLLKLTPVHLTQYTLLVILASFFNENLTFSDQISALSKSCYSHIRQLRCIRPYLDLKTASTVVHSKLD